MQQRKQVSKKVYLKPWVQKVLEATIIITAIANGCAGDLIVENTPIAHFVSNLAIMILCFVILTKYGRNFWGDEDE